MSRFIEALETRRLYSGGALARTIPFFPDSPAKTFEAGQKITLGVKVFDPGHEYQSQVNLTVGEYPTIGPPSPFPVLSATGQLKHNTAFFHFTFTTATSYRVDVSVPDLPPNPRALTGSWTTSVIGFQIKPSVPTPITVAVRPTSVIAYGGEFWPTRSDKYGNPDITWSKDDVERFVAVRPKGTRLRISDILARYDPVARRPNGDAYGVHVASGFGLILVPPATNTPSKIDVKIVITGTHHFSGWVSWLPS